MSEHLDINRAWWDSRAAAHAQSRDYDLDRFRSDPEAISDVVRFDRRLLGDLTGQRGVHLMCHIGTDTLSLHRLGADMTGLDLSPASLEQARTLAAEVGADITYVESDVDAALDVLEPASFDLVYTGIGALCWLPSVERWARTVAGLLRPGGRLVIRDLHPMLATIDEHDDAMAITYPYVEHSEPFEESDDQTYVADAEGLPELPTLWWNHGLGETVMALIGAGMRLDVLEEHPSVPWLGLPELMEPHPDLPGEFWLREKPERLAASFTVVATRT